MTFTDAAIEVLRLVGKPLHYKEITDVAIERNLLSHVGKSPEVTMGARLAALMKKETGDNPLVRVKPGVFGLKDWDASKSKGRGAKKAKSDDGEVVSAEVEADEAESTPDAGDEEVLVAASEEEEAAPDSDDEPLLDAPRPPAPPPVAPAPAARGRRREPARAASDDVEQGPDDQMRAEAVLGAGEIFDEEDDDDEPILGGADDAARAGGEAGADGRRRRRRRRRGRGPEVTPSEGGLPAYTATPVEGRAEVAPREGREREGQGREPREGREGQGREPREGQGREPREGREGQGREAWGRDRGERDRESRERAEAQGREAREGRGPQILELVGTEQLGGEDLAGKDMADVVATLLGTFDRNGGPVSLRHLAESLQRRGRSAGGDVQLLSSQIAAAVRADNARRTAGGLRPRFRFAGGRVGSTDWILGGELLLAEREAIAAIERYREAARRTFARKVAELPGHGFVELVVLALERFGIGALRSIRRPGGSGNEAHFAGKLRGPGDEFAVAIVVRRDGREIGRERVTELRGALHHYGNAQAGFLFTSGQILSGAREEAASVGVAPVALHDGASFARLCEDHEVAVVKSKLAIAIPDVDLFEALRAS